MIHRSLVTETELCASIEFGKLCAEIKQSAKYVSAVVYRSTTTLT